MDVMGGTEINWGTNPIKVRTKTKTFQHGYYLEGEVIDETFMEMSSPQLLSEEEIKNKGFGQYAEGDVYECFSLTEIPLNKESGTYKTLIFNNFEYEIIKNRGESLCFCAFIVFTCCFFCRQKAIGCIFS